ncbi:N-acyl homoserine lactonase family protein [Sciscionella marina]|uniref:N-acyl homoserine lactonase family protein n=1 Tax=Sciscionella marina TaxID=508770 RepID=UPI000365431A|nr:N-acyl homoserine lactonase family protein [Sciscionella marina]
MTLENSLLIVGGTGKLTVPLPTFLIEHERGLVLFDTGLVPEAVDDPHAVYGELVEEAGIEMTSEQRVDSQLAAIGFQPEDVTHVILSHTHVDHTGGLSLFPHAKFFIQRGELGYGYWPYPAAAAFFRPADFDPIRKIGWNEVDGDFDLFGDGSIQMLACPGHTPGNASLFVQLAEQSFILTGDTAHSIAAIENDLPASPDANTEKAVWSIRKLKQLAAARQSTIWVGHDPDQWPTFKHAPEYYV